MNAYQDKHKINLTAIWTKFRPLSYGSAHTSDYHEGDDDDDDDDDDDGEDLYLWCDYENELNL